jgi:hypothetical protein
MAGPVHLPSLIPAGKKPTIGSPGDGFLAEV